MLPEIVPLFLSFSTTSVTTTLFLLHFLLEFFIIPINASCMPVFFAQAISSRQVRTMELYFTKEGVPSAADCATLCGQRHFFCQSAIYNHDVRSCALSPNRPIQCSLSKQRFNYFHLKTDGADALSLLACIQICQQPATSTTIPTENVLNKEEIKRTTIKQQQSLEFSPIHDDEEKSSLRNKKKLFFPGDEHALDVLQRLFQMRQRLEQLLGEANRNGGGSGDQPSQNSTERQLQNIQKIAKDSKPTKTNFSASKINKNNDKEILIQSGGFVARVKPDEQIRVISTPLGIKQNNNKNKQQKHQNISELNKNNATTFDERRREESEYWKGGGGEYDEEPILINGRLIEPPTGYLHSVLIHHNGGISSEAESEEEGRATKNKILPSLDVAKLEKSNSGTIVCFKFMQHRNLQNYGNYEISIGMKRGLSLNECRCACANTWKLEEKAQCKSLHFGREEGLCELLSSDHSGKSDLVFNKSSDYHYVSCERKYLLKTAEKMCSNKSNEHQKFNNDGVFNNNTATSTEATNILLKSELTTNKPEINLNKNSKNSGTPNKSEFNLNKSEFNLNKSEFNSNKNSDTANKSEFNLNKNSEATNKSEFNLNKPEINLNKNNINVQQTSTTTQTTTQTTSINVVIDVDKNNQQCFERISGFSMNGTTTASLEHNVSIEQCKCLCANSLHSRYPFQCASVSYFGDERDCVLNLQNRQSAPEQFTPEPDQQVIYFGFLCHSKKAAEFVENVCNNNIEPSTTKGSISENYSKATAISSLNPKDSSTTKTFTNASKSSTNLDRQPSSTQSSSPSYTSLSDACFVEQPGYVLEGMALAARQQVSPQLCKCLCAIAEWKQLLEGNESKNEGGCKSSQFYKNSGTCLISGENRVSAPERFSFDENSSRQTGEQQSSYLDFRCGVDKKALFDYIQTNCPKELSKGRTSTITTPTTTNTTTEGTTKNELKEDENDQSKTLKKKKNKNKKNKKIDSKKSLKNIEDWGTSTTTATTFTTTNLNEEKEEEDDQQEQLETKTAIPSIEKPTELEEIGENWKTVNVEGEEKRKNRANQGGDEKEEEEEEEKNEEKRRGTTSIKVTAAQADPPREEDLHNKNENSGGSTTIDSVTATTTITTPITETITASTTPTTTANNNSSLINSTLTTLNNITTETTEFNATLNYTEGGTRESLLNGNLFEYPAVGQCRFSALYQTVFNGARLLKRLLVDTPSQCLAACHYESCRSANLIQMEDKQKICELFRDSIVEFRRNDVLSFDRLAVHFDSIQCKPPPSTIE